ncbi:MAG: hypothetical protein M5R42_10320 [Rhodocyclaceae bacterium]|nr:hypothetical protein [Rhodocyclaceae bacterium]
MSGVVKRSSGKSTTWVNGTPQDDMNAATGVRVKSTERTPPKPPSSPARNPPRPSRWAKPSTAPRAKPPAAWATGASPSSAQAHGRSKPRRPACHPMRAGEKSAPAGRRSKSPTRKQRGAALLIFFLLLVMAGLGYLVSGLSPESVEVRRAQQNQEAMLQAREALIGYALQYREQQLAQGQPGQVYGYLPLPDLGTTRNNNVGCVIEGCDAANFAGNALSTTVIGRLPWRTLGLEPLRDGNGECLWYAVSGSHQRQQLATPMNWDSLAHLDIVVADGTAALSSVLTSAHERPVVVIFSPGPPLPGQDRAPAGGDDVTRCGGNYNVANYLDPATATALGGVTNYLAGTNKASAVTDPNTPKALASQGKIFDSGTAFIPNACQGANCNLVANDIGLSVTGDALFGAIRKSAYFRTDINAMLDRMTFCLRDQGCIQRFHPGGDQRLHLAHRQERRPHSGQYLLRRQPEPARLLRPLQGNGLRRQAELGQFHGQQRHQLRRRPALRQPARQRPTARHGGAERRARQLSRRRQPDELHRPRHDFRRRHPVRPGDRPRRSGRTSRAAFRPAAASPRSSRRSSPNWASASSSPTTPACAG